MGLACLSFYTSFASTPSSFHRSSFHDIYPPLFVDSVTHHSRIQGSLVFGNIWAIMHDPGLYREPEVFVPRRWLRGDGKEGKETDPRAFVFGFGRRRCPGNHLVESPIWLLITSILATPDIHKVRDEKGAQMRTYCEV
ncbi:cytochrome P450 [Suillus lakei]|nr:cytochrome P450 [Suillus lakei]